MRHRKDPEQASPTFEQGHSPDRWTLVVLGGLALGATVAAFGANEVHLDSSKREPTSTSYIAEAPATSTEAVRPTDEVTQDINEAIEKLSAEDKVIKETGEDGEVKITIISPGTQTTVHQRPKDGQPSTKEVASITVTTQPNSPETPPTTVTLRQKDGKWLPATPDDREPSASQLKKVLDLLNNTLGLSGR